MKIRKLRLSHTLLNLWIRGETDKAIDYYFKLNKFEPTPKMIEGLAIDKAIQEEIIKNKRLPDFLGGEKLVDPRPQLKLEIEHSKYFDFVGVIDCYDNGTGTIYEFKTGVLNSFNYLNQAQTKLYAYLCQKSNLLAKEIVIIRYSQKENNYDWSNSFVNEETINEAKNFIDSIAPEIYLFFIEQGLL